VAGGSAGEVHANKIADTMKASMKTGTPFVFINDSGGARVQEGVASLAGYARIFHQNVMLSGLVPQISMICGPWAPRRPWKSSSTANWWRRRIPRRSGRN
jgi:methylmalonyl-CoA carboxyltransferase large subunit